MKSRHLPILLVLSLGLVPLARAEEVAEKASAREHYAKARAALPAPAVEHGFRWAGLIRNEGIGIGKIEMKAEMLEGPDGKPAWKLFERFVIMNGQLERSAEAWVARDLEPISGAVSERRPGLPPAQITWKRTPDGFQVEKVVQKDGETVKESQLVEHEGSSMTTLTSLWLFCRLGMASEGSFETTVFDPSPDRGGAYLEQARWSFAGTGAWKEHEAWLMRGQKGTHPVVAGFDKETKELLGADFLDAEGKVKLAFTPGDGAAPTTEKEPDEKPAPAAPQAFAAPAASAKGAAMTAAFALATGDLDLVEKIYHWPSFYEDQKKAYEAKTAGKEDTDPFPAIEDFKKAILGRFAQSLQKRPPAMIQQGLTMIEGQLVTEKLEDGLTRVQFPEMFRSMKLDVGKVDGAWYLVRIPESPK